jgi:hypothetical protein
MANLTAQEVTNWYLYSQAMTPQNLVDETLIRPAGDASHPPVQVPQDLTSYMTTGPGRFATGALFQEVRDFFASIDQQVVAAALEPQLGMVDASGEVDLAFRRAAAIRCEIVDDVLPEACAELVGVVAATAVDGVIAGEARRASRLRSFR